MKTAKIPAKDRAKIIGECPLFAQVQGPAVDELAARSIARHYTDGDLLFRQGERAEGFFVISEGEVEVFRRSPAGREQVLHLFGDGELCGEVPMFQGGTFPASARAAGEVLALYLPGDVFLDQATQHPEILLEMLAVLSMRLRRFVQLIDDLSLKEVSARLAKYLLDLQTREGKARFALDCDKGQLAARIGTIAETLSRSLGKLRKAGLIEVRGRSITILDRERLRDVK